MRKEHPRKHSYRDVTKFLFFPLTIWDGRYGETRWLERATIKQNYSWSSSDDRWAWRNVNFVNK